MRQWDYLHCPPNTAHITIGAGDGPCALVMVGTRSPDRTLHYLVEPAAAKHGASVEVATDSPKEAYAARAPIEPARSPWPLDD
jgi:oxalate decarboxylase/phosphoglucose isomerase-like protein (cupin superfamily)